MSVALVKPLINALLILLNFVAVVPVIVDQCLGPTKATLNTKTLSLLI